MVKKEVKTDKHVLLNGTVVSMETKAVTDIACQLKAHQTKYRAGTHWKRDCVKQSFFDTEKR